jgi:hypothetical protein
LPVFQLLPGAKSIAMPDGRTIAADRRGRVRVDDSDAHAIAGSAAKRRYDAIQPVGTTFRGMGERTTRECACGHSPWPWVTTCPKCGSDLRTDTTTDSE